MTDRRRLYVVDFSLTDQSRLANFSCGNDPWSRHVAEWIRGPDVLDSMKRWGTRVWLFETAEEETVGFASLGTSVWKWPPPRGDRTPIILIPMLGIDVRFQGKPSDERWRYSRQIMAHVLAEAKRLAVTWSAGTDTRPRWLVLMVHRDNARAIHFYEQCGFERIKDVVRKHDHIVMKFWIDDIKVAQSP